ncbi:hypothetical protein, partial [Xanthomonas arboricola]
RTRDLVATCHAGNVVADSTEFKGFVSRSKGADIFAGNDVTLSGRNVLLDAATNTASQVESHRVTQYGVTAALSGYAVEAARAADAAGKAQDEGDERMAALYAAKAA